MLKLIYSGNSRSSTKDATILLFSRNNLYISWLLFVIFNFLLVLISRLINSSILESLGAPKKEDKTLVYISRSSLFYKFLLRNRCHFAKYQNFTERTDLEICGNIVKLTISAEFSSSRPKRGSYLVTLPAFTGTFEGFFLTYKNISH